MRLSQTNYSINQPKTFVKKQTTNSDPFPPWTFREFSLAPEKAEYEDDRDGTFLRRETVVRFLGKPFTFGEVWKGVMAKDKDGNIITDNKGEPRWKKKIFRSTAGHPGFDGRDVYQSLINANLAPLRARSEKGEKVTSEEWKEAFNAVPAYEEKRAFEIIDFQWHHFQKDGDKAVLLPHLDRNCPLCKSLDPYVSEKRFGGRKYWPMKKSEFSSFVAEESRLGGYATTTAGEVLECIQGQHLIGMACTKCGKHVVTKDMLQNAKDQQVMKWTDEKHLCSCGNDGYLKDILVQGVERRLNYRDVAWKIEWSATKTTRSGSPSISNTRVVFTPIIPDNLSPLVDAGDFGPLPQEITDFGQTPDMLGVPYDLADCYRPESRHYYTGDKIDPKEFANREQYCQAVLESQAAALNIDNPYRLASGEEGEDGFETIPF